MKVMILEPKGPDTKDAMEVIEALKQKIEAGDVIAFAAVAIEPDDTTTAWASSTKPVSRLRMIGAIATLQACYINGEVD